MLSVKQRGIKYHFWAFGMMRPEIELRSPGPLANTPDIDVIYVPQTSMYYQNIAKILTHSSINNDKKFTVKYFLKRSVFKLKKILNF